MKPWVLTLNGGSSSIKFALFDCVSCDDRPGRKMHGYVERIGQPGARLVATHGDSPNPDIITLGSCEPRDAAHTMVDYVFGKIDRAHLRAIAHRVVHGGHNLQQHQPITPALIEELRNIVTLDLAHLPAEIHLIELMQEVVGDALQIACFDTAFFQSLPCVATRLPIPRTYFDRGIRKFGFHGLSYTYLISEFERQAGNEQASGRVILAHLGSGSSMTGLKGKRVLDTTMSLTPNAGLMMGTRPGDMDPAAILHLMRTEGFSVEEMDDFIAHQCGLLGVSGTTSDMRDLWARRGNDSRAGDAIDLYVYLAKKQLGALTSVLGGIDTLVFSGGIGEHSFETRRAICEGLEYLGIRLDDRANQAKESIVSAADSRTTVRVIATDEESVMAKIASGFQ